MVPQTKEIIDSVFTLAKNNRLLPHEESLLVTFVSLVEKDVRGTLTEDDVKDSKVLFRWIAAIDTPVPAVGKAGRDHLRQSRKVRETFEMQIGRLDDPAEFIKDPQWPKVLLAFYRSHILTLIDHRLLKFLVEEVYDGNSKGVKRQLSPAERLTLFENGIRKKSR
jgi:hypothetical protein